MLKLKNLSHKKTAKSPKFKANLSSTFETPIIIAIIRVIEIMAFKPEHSAKLSPIKITVSNSNTCSETLTISATTMLKIIRVVRREASVTHPSK